MNNESPPDPCETDRPNDQRVEEIHQAQAKGSRLSFVRVQEAYNRAFRTRPRELIVCINGHPCVRRAVEASTEIVISFWLDEAVEFIEVLNEGGLRLAYMDVEQRNLANESEQGEVPLSEGRTLELAVFRDPAGRIGVKVTYRDFSQGK